MIYKKSTNKLLWLSRDCQTGFFLKNQTQVYVAYRKKLFNVNTGMLK